MDVKNVSALAMMVLASLAFASCSRSGDNAAPAAATTTAAVDGGHDDWWCAEHGVPEEVCALCNTKLVADFKAKGDWCEEHDRPDSQCFLCHPEKEAEFAALYVAKFGEQPPKPIAERAEHNHDHE